MYLRYAVLVLCDLLASALNYLLAPFVVLFADDAGWLPNWLWWFQTPGDSLDADYSGKRYPGPTTGWRRWYSRTAWLYRNAMYGFDIDVLGAKPLPGDVVTVTGDPLVSNHADSWREGTVRYTLMRDGKAIYFQTYTVKKWCATRYLRSNLGWKLWSFTDDPTETMQLVFSPNPFRRV